jgi:hypothetical protein
MTLAGVEALAKDRRRFVSPTRRRAIREVDRRHRDFWQAGRQDVRGNPRPAAASRIWKVVSGVLELSPTVWVST